MRSGLAKDFGPSVLSDVRWGSALGAALNPAVRQSPIADPDGLLLAHRASRNAPYEHIAIRDPAYHD